MTEKYVRMVRYSDLDKSNHMTNLRYINMLQDAYDKTFWNQFEAKQMELCFYRSPGKAKYIPFAARRKEILFLWLPSMRMRVLQLSVFKMTYPQKQPNLNV